MGTGGIWTKSRVDALKGQWKSFHYIVSRGTRGGEAYHCNMFTRQFAYMHEKSAEFQ